MFLGFDDVINIMLVFLANKAPFFRQSFKYLAFLTQIRKDYAIFVICTKNETICEIGSINMLILADKACQFTDFLNITSLLRHNEILLKM